MKRRAFVAGLGGAAAIWPLGAIAQQRTNKVRRIGVVLGYSDNDPVALRFLAAFQDALNKLGWNQSRATVEMRWAREPENIRAIAHQMSGQSFDAMVGTPAQVVIELRKAMPTTPIVFTNVPDPVSIGLVQSLAKPGGHITGFTNFEHALAGKWLDIVRELVPRASHIGVAYNPDNPAWQGRLRLMETLASPLSIQLTASGTTSDAEIESAFAAFARNRVDGAVVFPSIFAAAHRKGLVEAAARHRVPAAYPFRHFSEAGGLVSYGVDATEQYRSAASYVSRILGGESPGGLPVQQPTKFELVINLKTAKALGLAVPPTLLARADEVIE